MLKSLLIIQICYYLIQPKPSKIESVMRWWSKCISMVIPETASRDVAFKAAKMSKSAFARQRQSDVLILMPQVVTAGPSTHEEDLEDVGRNVDLHMFNQDVFEDAS